MKQNSIIGIVIIFLLCFSWPVWGQVGKVVITDVSVQELAGDVSISIRGEIQAEGEGSIFLQASTTYENKEYFTAPGR